MTLKQAQAIVRAVHPRATCFYSWRHKGYFIHEIHYAIAPIVGPDIAAETATEAWKKTAAKQHSTPPAPEEQ